MVQDSDKRIFWDNDSLAALVAGETNVDLVILLSDVEGLYKEPPRAGKKGDVIDTYLPDAKYTIGAGSRAGIGPRSSCALPPFVRRFL